MRCLLIGNYGVGNVGDEALREYFLRAFSDIDWTVVSASGIGRNEVPRLPFGLRSFFLPWPRTLVGIARADAVVFGGGSLFTDSESVVACVLWWWHALVARMLRKPIFLAFQGVGPFRTKLGNSLARATFRKATFVSVRDEASLKRLQSWNLSRIPLPTFDPAFAYFSSKKPASSSKKILTIIPRGNSNDAFFTEVSAALRRSFDEIRIVLMQPSRAERAIAEKIKATMTKSATIIPVSSVDQLLEEISVANEVISQRYHGALAALAIGVPVAIVPQVAGDKLDELRTLQKDPKRLGELLTLTKRGEEGMREELRKAEK